MFAFRQPYFFSNKMPMLGCSLLLLLLFCCCFIVVVVGFFLFTMIVIAWTPVVDFVCVTFYIDMVYVGLLCQIQAAVRVCRLMLACHFRWLSPWGGVTQQRTAPRRRMLTSNVSLLSYNSMYVCVCVFSVTVASPSFGSFVIRYTVICNCGCAAEQVRTRDNWSIEHKVTCIYVCIYKVMIIKKSSQPFTF